MVRVSKSGTRHEPNPESIAPVLKQPGCPVATN